MSIDTIREAPGYDHYWQIVLHWSRDMGTIKKLSIHEMHTLTERLQSITDAVLSTIDSEAETGWMIEKHNTMPMWWNGCLKREGNGAWSSEPNDGIRFSRKVDAELCAIAQGFSLSKVQITEHRWG